MVTLEKPHLVTSPAPVVLPAIAKLLFILEIPINSTTWQLSDGHKQVVYYSNDVRFEDDNGKLVDYDASLISVQQAKSVEGVDLKGYAYENKQGDMKHYIPKEMDTNTPLRLENGEYSLEVSPMFVTSEDTKEVAVQKEKVTDIYGKTKEKKV